MEAFRMLNYSQYIERQNKYLRIVSIISTFISIFALKCEEMENRDLNRLKVVLAEKKRTNKWLAEQLGKDQGTVSKWCTNTSQPDIGTFLKIAKLLEVDLNELVRFEHIII